MQNFNKKYNLNFNKYLLFFLILSLGLGFLLGENSTGGAYIDYSNQKNIAKQFAFNFNYTFFNYDNYSSRHSPILIILLSFFEKINTPDFLIRFSFLILNLLLPLVFFKILVEKFGKQNKNIYILLVGLIFLSPTFRSLSIWPDSRILGLTIFSFSILYYLKFENSKNSKFIIYNILLYTLASYISPNFAIFSIYFFYKYLIYFKSYKKILYIIILNILLSIPAIYYIFVLDINFLNKSAAIGFSTGQNIIFVNIFNNILITFTIIFFYLFPFLIIKIFDFRKNKILKNLIYSILISIILLYFFDYNYQLSGGGIFLKFSNAFFGNNYFFYFICFLSIFVLLNSILFNKDNILIFLLIILNNPQYTIYHKYFDPFLLLILFSIFDIKFNIEKIKKQENVIFIYFYFFVFLLISNLKFIWKI